MSNKKLGNDFEAFFCEKLFSNGYWVHNMAQNQAGQPADVIAVKNKKPYLIDCKVCTNKGFAISRVEENQDLSMTLWQSCGNGVGWFALLIDDEIFLISHPALMGYGKTRSKLTEEEIKTLSMPFDEWVMKCR